jgi:hypothetical protein
VCNCSWSSAAQSFSGPSPVELVTIFYCLAFETSLLIASYDSQGYGGGIRPCLHTACLSGKLLVCYYHRPTAYGTPNSRVQFLILVVTVCLCSRCPGNVLEPLPSKTGSPVSGSPIPAFRRCLLSRCLAMDA